MARERPTHAVTFVDNHDSQPLQALESPVAPWFKPLAYAFILLRQEGYPCVFIADYDGAIYQDDTKVPPRQISLPSHRRLIDCFLAARRDHAHGPQIDYLDDPNRIGWTRLGSDAHATSLAVLMSNGDAGSQWMDVRRPQCRFRDLTGHVGEIVTTNGDGWGEFRCNGGSVSVWVQD